MMPGQLGPIKRVPLVREYGGDANHIEVGTPSVMQTTSGSAASMASRIASAAYGGGTKISDALAPVSRTALGTVLNTGTFVLRATLARRHAADDVAYRKQSSAAAWKCPRAR